MNDSILSALLDSLIPPSEPRRMPGAGSLGLESVVRDLISEHQAVLDAGVEALAGSDFLASDAENRTSILRDLEATHPEFVAVVYAAACAAYYQHPKVLLAIGMEARPPHPVGFEIEAGDLTGLERVRERGKLYRDAP